MDLGYKSEYGGGPVSPETGNGKDKVPPVVYPSILLRGPAAAAFCKACTAGETLEGNVKVRVVSTQDAVERRQEYGGNGGASVELEIESLDLPGVGKTAMEEETPEDAVDNYRRKKEAPDDEETD